MVGDPEDLHPSKEWTDSFPSTDTTAGQPTEEQFGDIHLYTIKHYMFLYCCS